MGVRPVFENQADEEVKAVYDKLKKALESQSLPLFFAYLGAFPEYLTYISQSLVDNLADPKFKTITQKLSEEMVPLINSRLAKSDSLKEWTGRYQYSPSFHHFQKDLGTIFILNLKLAFVFLALREAIKGWAVAAKRIEAEVTRKEKEEEFTAADFIFDQTVVDNYQKNAGSQGEGSQANLAIAVKREELIESEPFSLEKDLLPEYFNFCRNDFATHMKTNIFWAVRIGLEDMILATLPHFPHLILSPINVVFNLTSKYPDFPDLLYLLAEQFPTASVQRLMFSGYMKI